MIKIINHFRNGAKRGRDLSSDDHIYAPVSNCA